MYFNEEQSLSIYQVVELLAVSETANPVTTSTLVILSEIMPIFDRIFDFRQCQNSYLAENDRMLLNLAVFDKERGLSE